MTTADIYLVYRPSTATDSMGGDLPWQSYIYVTENGTSTHPNDAKLYLTREAAEKAVVNHFVDNNKMVDLRVGTLHDAIKWYGVECYDRAEY